MKKLLILSLSLFLSMSCSTQTAQGIQKSISVEEFSKVIETEKGTILDVRTAKEFATGHLKGAQNVVYSMFGFKEELANLDKSKTYFIYCRSGARSGRAFGIMKKEGFTNIYNMNGGIMGWQSANKPVVK